MPSGVAPGFARRGLIITDGGLRSPGPLWCHPCLPCCAEDDHLSEFVITIQLLISCSFFLLALAGDVHFNDDKHFTIESTKGKNLLWVAVHELGHSIGLDHSNVKGSIMYPYYQGFAGLDFDLTPDDILGAQALYGKHHLKYNADLLQFSNSPFSLFSTMNQPLFPPPPLPILQSRPPFSASLTRIFLAQPQYLMHS